ncbi:MAG TPA: DUF6328 family protein [Stellaceae bacterium]|nr:DUF6328 family protein [Stellaceae bacterium]
MELGKKVKTALDETRILILGANILLGFQLRGPFESAFKALPPLARDLDGLALILMLATVALLIAPSLDHRIAAGGEASGRIHGLISKTAATALLPFALALGLDVGIGVERMAGWSWSLAAGLVFAALALLLWFGLGLARRSATGERERMMTASQADAVEATPLHEKIQQMLTEARVVLPGAQALLGFQLSIIVTNGFEQLPPSAKLMHGVGVCLLAIAVILLMTPAAYHRLVFAGEDAAEVHRVGSILIVAATVPLALGISADVYVVMTKISVWPPLDAGVAAGTLAGFVLLWYVAPLLRRRFLRPAIESRRA